MKAKSLVVLALVLGGMFTGAGAALAEDDIAVLPKPVCAENEYIDFDANGEPYCVAVSTVVEAPVGVVSEPCWVTEDGVDVCARGFVTGEEPMPIDETCTTDVAGTESYVCADWMATTGIVPGDESLGGVPLGYDDLVLEKNLSLTSAGGSTDGTLAFLGLFFGLVGGVVIALKQKPRTK